MVKKAEVVENKFIAMFGNVNIGDKTFRIGANVDRQYIKLAKAESLLCERRISCSLQVAEDGKTPDQGFLPGMDNFTILQGQFDVKSIRFDTDSISFGLVGVPNNINVNQLSKFAQKMGLLTVVESGDIPEKERSKKEPDEEDQ